MTFDMGKAWNDAIALIRANREVMLVVAGVFAFLPSLALSLILPPMQPAESLEGMDAIKAASAVYEQNGGWIILFSLMQTTGVLALLTLLRGSHKPTVGEAIKTAFTGLLPYVATNLIAVIALALFAGILVAVPSAAGLQALTAIAVAIAVVAVIYFGVRLCMSTPAIAIEKVYNPIKVLRRSWELTRGNAGRLLVFFLLLMVAYVVIGMVLNMVMVLPAALLGQGPASQLINGIVSGLLSAIVTVIAVAILAAIYRQLAGPWSSTDIKSTFE